MREKIGVGIVLDLVLVGVFVDIVMKMDLLPDISGYPARCGVYVAGMAIMAFAMFVCMTSGQGVGPRDTLMLGIGRRIRRVPIGAVQIMMLAGVFIAGWMLGGPVGIGTIISVVGMGSLLQFYCTIFRVEPRDVVHKSLGDYFVLTHRAG